MMRLIGLGLVLLLVVAGCSRKVVSTTAAKVIKDSVRVQYVPRLVEVKVPGETITLTKYIECDSTTNKPKPAEFKAKGARAAVAISVKDDGEVTATGGCDSLTEVVSVMDKEIFRLRHENEKETITQEVYKTRSIDKFCRSFTGVVLVVGVAYVFYKINRVMP